MWSDEEMGTYLKVILKTYRQQRFNYATIIENEQKGRDVFNELIRPAMRNSVVKSLVCVQDMVENRQNSFELYGYDFMIDENLKTWLIEINSSPSMDYSTVTLIALICFL